VIVVLAAGIFQRAKLSGRGPVERMAAEADWLERKNIGKKLKKPT
jgi:hypothetical protein